MALFYRNIIKKVGFLWVKVKKSLKNRIIPYNSVLFRKKTVLFLNWWLIIFNRWQILFIWWL